MRIAVPVLVAHAIHRHLEVLEDFPECRNFLKEEIEAGLKGFVAGVQNQLTVIITCYGQPYFDTYDAAGLFGLLRGYGVRLKNLHKMCQFILDAEVGAIILPEVKDGHVGEYEESAIYKAIQSITPFSPPHDKP